jgi:hypothetical protein
LISSASFFLSASVGFAWATTIGDTAEPGCCAPFCATALAPLIAMAQTKPMTKLAIVCFMVASL